jgi:hypothetical protein
LNPSSQIGRQIASVADAPNAQQIRHGQSWRLAIIG